MCILKIFDCLIFAALMLLCFCGCTESAEPVSDSAAPPESTCTTSPTESETTTTTTVTAFDPAYVPAYHGEPYCEINNSLPFFKEEDRTADTYEFYSPLDALGRCGVCQACIGVEMMPTEKRGSIGMIKPSGWQLVRYEGLVDGDYLFNRCHLIGYMLTGQNANECNLITGTRYLNKEGMLPFEILAADYIRDTGNHVLYRVTPVFSGENLLADGVLMEALSVEDDGAGVRFNVYCYNVQPQIVIDYATGESHLEGEEAPPETLILPAETSETEAIPADRSIPADSVSDADYILNTNTMRFHRPDCKSVADIKEKNKEEYTGDRDTLIAEGYLPCQRCKP